MTWHPSTMSQRYWAPGTSPFQIVVSYTYWIACCFLRSSPQHISTMHLGFGFVLLFLQLSQDLLNSHSKNSKIVASMGGNCFSPKCSLTTLTFCKLPPVVTTHLPQELGKLGCKIPSNDEIATEIVISTSCKEGTGKIKVYYNINFSPARLMPNSRGRNVFCWTSGTEQSCP